MRRLAWLLPLVALAAACAQAVSAVPDADRAPDPIAAVVATEMGARPDDDASTPAATTPAAATTPEERPATASTTTTRPEAVFSGEIVAIDDAIAARMTASWRSGCPVGLDELRLVRVTHHDFAGGVTEGEIVVNEDVAADVLAVFEALFAAGYPIERMELVDVYGADDGASMAANNTSGFNCRVVAGTARWSQHAYGTAIDLNPLINPFVHGARVAPPLGADYADRTVDHPALIRPGDAVTAAFSAIGWTWGGTWTSAKDYQHFSLSGR